MRQQQSDRKAKYRQKQKQLRLKKKREEKRLAKAQRDSETKVRSVYESIQNEELESLGAIFLDSLKVHSTSPLSLSITVTGKASESEKKVTLDFKMKPTYPKTIPLIAVAHDMPISQFPPDLHKTLESLVKEVSLGLKGEQQVFVVVEAVRDWLNNPSNHHHTPNSRRASAPPTELATTTATTTTTALAPAGGARPRSTSSAHESVQSELVPSLTNLQLDATTPATLVVPTTPTSTPTPTPQTSAPATPKSLDANTTGNAPSLNLPALEQKTGVNGPMVPTFFNSPSAQAPSASALTQTQTPAPSSNPYTNIPTVSHIVATQHGTFDFVKLTCVDTYTNKVRRVRRMLASELYQSQPSSDSPATSSPTSSTNPRILALLKKIHSIPDQAARALVIEFEDLFFSTKDEMHNAPKDSPKMTVYSRNMCMWCGRIFTSRAKLFAHLNANVTHDTTPDVLATVARLCLVGYAGDAARLLWDCTDKAHAVLFSVMHVFIEKIQSATPDKVDRLWKLVNSLAQIVVDTGFQDEGKLIEIAASRTIPKHFGTFDSQQECPTCHECFAYFANHETILLTCAHRTCQIPTDSSDSINLTTTSTTTSTTAPANPPPSPQAHSVDSFPCPHCACPTSVSAFPYAAPMLPSLILPDAVPSMDFPGLNNYGETGADDEEVMAIQTAVWQVETSAGVWKELHETKAAPKTGLDENADGAALSLNDELEDLYQHYMDLENLPIEARAVSLESLVRFTQDHPIVVVNGVKKSILEVSTEEVINNIVIPECRQLGFRRYHEAIARSYGRTHVGAGTVFVSHAWSNNWALMVAMLAHSFSWKRCQELPVYFWIDAFAVCQIRHSVSQKGGLVYLDNLTLHKQANTDDLVNFERPLYYSSRTFGVMDSEGVGLAEKDLCQRAWCLFEFATTLSLGNVLSFRLGNLRKRRVTKQLASVHLHHLSHYSSSNSLTTNNTGNTTSTDPGTTSDSSVALSLSMPDIPATLPCRPSSIILNNHFPAEFRILDTMEIIWAKPSKLKKHASNLDVRQAKCRVESDMDNVIRPRMVLLGKGDVKRGYELVNETVREGMKTLQELLEWRDNELSYAAFNGQMDVLKKLLASGDDPNQPDKTDKTPLHRASKSGTADAVALLLDAGAQADARDRDRNTPLHFAAQGGHEQCIVALLAKGADPDSKNRLSQSPINLALQYPKCIQILIEGRKKRRGRSNSTGGPNGVASPPVVANLTGASTSSELGSLQMPNSQIDSNNNSSNSNKHHQKPQHLKKRPSEMALKKLQNIVSGI